MAGIVECFEREHGCTEAEWIGWLPAAAHGHRLACGEDRTARIDIGGGALHLAWQVLPLRRIALIELPRLQVGYAFVGVPPDARERFMRRFDLEMQRGGG